MSKGKTVFMCNECGSEFPRWSGRCAVCDAWNSLVEMKVSDKRSVQAQYAGESRSLPTSLAQLETGSELRFSAGIGELDRVLGGGMVPGAVMLLGGDPGIGKSTLLLQTAIALARMGLKILYISGEESLQQIKMRAERLGGENEDIILLAETEVEAMLSQVERINPRLVIVDSIQTTFTSELTSASGSVSQVREATGRIVRFAKQQEIPFFIVGHVTKDGAIAGPRVLEHMVDTVLYFEGDNNQAFRILRAVKNRFGSTNEIGVFTMEAEGLVGVENPSAFLLQRRGTAAIGSVVTAAWEGSRTILVEIQSLLSETGFGNPRRMTTGLDYNRVSMLMAVLQKKAGLFLNNYDAYVNVIGGLRIHEPAADLAVALAISSSLLDIPLDPAMVVIGEVALTGEIRNVSQTSLRVAEAERMGFSSCMLPAGYTGKIPAGNMEIIPVATIQEAIKKINRRY